MIGDDSVLLDLVDETYETFAAADDGEGSEGASGGGGCFIAAMPFARSAAKEFWAILIFGSGALTGSAALGRRKQKK
jgi:hypothetical protein